MNQVTPIRKMVSDLKGNNIKTEIQTVTPKQAAKWLEGHQNIRAINHRQVDAIANDIRNGNWKVTHQGICFDENGKLVDGQHRLHAIVEANQPVRIMVSIVPGITAQDPIDEGRRRSLTVLTGHNTKVIAALGVLRQFEAGQQIHRPMTLAESLEMYDHHEETFKAIQGSGVWSRYMTGGVVAACVWAWPCDPDKVREFMKQLSTGEMIQRGDPSYAFRNWAQRDAGRRHADVFAFAACNCIRAFLANQKLSTVYTSESGYRALTAQRRKHRVPCTPDASAVPGVALARTRDEED